MNTQRHCFSYCSALTWTPIRAFSQVRFPQYSFLDEGMVALAAEQVYARSEQTMVVMTDLSTIFLKAVKTPSVMLCRCWIVKHNARRLWAEGSIEDGNGRVRVKGSATFAKI